MFKLFTKKKNLVGIDIGSSSVKLVQLIHEKDGYRLVHAAIQPLPPEAIVDNSLMDTTSITGAVKSLIQSLGIKTKDVVCSISGNAVIIRKISLPATSNEELEDQISWEAEQYIPFDINDVHLDFQIMGPDLIDPSKMQVLLVASKKDITEDYISLFTESGLHLNILDVDAFALQNCYEINNLQLEEVVALVNIGANTININVVKDGHSLFTRDIQIGGSRYNIEIQKQFGVNAEESEKMKLLSAYHINSPVGELINRINENIAQEIRRSVDFYNSSASGDERVIKACITGGCSKVHGLQEIISARLGLEVEYLNPFGRLKHPEKDFDPEYLKEIAPLMSICVGLAIRKEDDK